MTTGARLPIVHRPAAGAISGLSTRRGLSTLTPDHLATQRRTADQDRYCLRLPSGFRETDVAERDSAMTSCCARAKASAMPLRIASETLWWRKARYHVVLDLNSSRHVRNDSVVRTRAHEQQCGR